MDPNPPETKSRQQRRAEARAAQKGDRFEGYRVPVLRCVAAFNRLPPDQQQIAHALVLREGKRLRGSEFDPERAVNMLGEVILVCEELPDAQLDQLVNAIDAIAVIAEAIAAEDIGDE